MTIVILKIIRLSLCLAPKKLRCLLAFRIGRDLSIIVLALFKSEIVLVIELFTEMLDRIPKENPNCSNYKKWHNAITKSYFSDNMIFRNMRFYWRPNA